MSKSHGKLSKIWKELKIGDKFNHLTAIRKNSKTEWVFQCDCHWKTCLVLKVSSVARDKIKSCKHCDTPFEKTITFNEKTQTIRRWAKDLNIKYSSIMYRLRQGLSFEDIVNDKKKCSICKQIKKRSEFLKKEKGTKTDCRCAKCKVAYNNEYIKKKFKIDINFKISCKLRSRLKTALKNNKKTGSAVKDLGCSIEKFKLWMEMQFQDGMTWDNYGFYGWHIDHKKPLAKFNLQDREELLQACHYTNLQPMWAKDNWSKGDTYIEIGV